MEDGQWYLHPIRDQSVFDLTSDNDKGNVSVKKPCHDLGFAESSNMNACFLFGESNVIKSGTLFLGQRTERAVLPTWRMCRGTADATSPLASHCGRDPTKPGSRCGQPSSSHGGGASPGTPDGHDGAACLC